MLKIMREQRAVRVRLGTLEVELSPLAFSVPQVPDKAEPVGLENGGEPTDEQLLYWSAPEPLPTAKKEERQ